MPVQVDPSLGKAFGKPDIERLGIFVEASYMNGKKYVSPFQKGPDFKGKNMLSGGRKTKNGTQHGYFEDEFKRLFEGEGINWKKDKKQKLQAALKFNPTGPSKWHSSPGDYYGCFSGNIEHFSNERRKPPKTEHLKGNFITNAMKQGGPGYADICLSKYPEHLADPYKPKEKPTKGKQIPKTMGGHMITMIYPKPYFDSNPFVDPDGKIGPTYIKPKQDKIPDRGKWVPTGPGKWQGGMHGGCFTPFPEWMEGKKSKPEKKLPKAYFYPQSMAVKEMFTKPILRAKVDASINAQNYATFEPTYIKHLLD